LGWPFKKRSILAIWLALLECTILGPNFSRAYLYSLWGEVQCVN
jgi:hypothetical protein